VRSPGGSGGEPEPDEVYPATDAALSVASTGTLPAGGVQAENQATFPCTSYIPTTVATVTRNADVLSYPANSMVNVGTAYAEVALPTGSPTTVAAFVNLESTGTSGRALTKAGGQAVTTISSFDGVTTNTKSGITNLTGGTPVKVAATWAGLTMKVGETSAALQSAAFDGTMGDALAVHIGHAAGASQPNGWTKNVKIWKTAATDGQVAAL